GISAAQQGRVAGRSARVGVVVVTIGEIRSVIKKEAESALAELVAIAFQIVATALIAYDNDDEPGAAIVGRPKAQADEREKEKSKGHTAQEACQRAASVQSGSYAPNPLNCGCR